MLKEVLMRLFFWVWLRNKKNDFSTTLSYLEACDAEQLGA